MDVRSPFPSWTPKVYSNSRPLSPWYHPTISSSLIPFSSFPQSFPASGSFQMSQFFTPGVQSIGVSTSASVPSNEFSGLISFTMDWLYLLAVQGKLESSPTPKFKSINPSILSFVYSPTLTPYMITGKTIALTRQTFVDKVMSLLFNMLYNLAIPLHPKSKLFYFHGCRHHLQWFYRARK